MPVVEGVEGGILPHTHNYFYRWGSSGKKYYFKPNDEVSRMIAKDKATKQGDAVRASMAGRSVVRS